MNLNFRTLAAFCSVAVALSSGCRGSQDVQHDSDAVSPLFSQHAQDAYADIVPVEASAEELTPASSYDCTIRFDEDSIGVRGDAVQINGRSAVITEGGCFSVTGECTDGKLVIDSAEPVSLILAGLKLSGDIVIECLQETSLSVTLEEGSENSLSGETAAISAAGTVVINGGGLLELSGGSAILCGGLKLCGGVLDITSQRDALVCGEYLVAVAGETSVSSGGDGVRVTSDGDNGYFSMSGGVLDVVSAQDGIHAQSAVFVSGGELKLNSGGGSTAVMHFRSGRSYPYAKHGGFATDGSVEFDFSALTSGDGRSAPSKKGIKTDGVVRINGGSTEVSSADDSVYARGDVQISSGALLLSSGDDAIHADNTLAVSGGSVEVSDSYNALEGRTVSVEGGMLDLSAFGDGISAVSPVKEDSGCYISISDGIVMILADGDGISSEGNAAVSGGEVTVYSSSKDGGSLVYADSFAVSGGTLAAFGARGSRAPSVVSGVCVSVFAEASAGSTVQLEDSTGSVLLSRELPVSCGTVILYMEGLRAGESCKLTSDGEVLAQIETTDGICGGGPDGRDTGGVVTQIKDGAQSGAVAA